MTCTDHDLKRFKYFCHEDGAIGTFLVTKLIARLEAAELCAEHGKLLRAYLGPLASDYFEHGVLEVWDRREKNWRKACGK